MTVWANLTEEEAYLYAILTDPSGIDVCELTWYDANADEEVWRAWPYQRVWWANRDRLQIEQSARAVGKTVGITVRGFSFPFRHPGQEMCIAAPMLVHLEPVTRAIENRILDVRLTREMLPKNKSRITHRPFQCDFMNGAHIIGRIPQRDGSGMKGIHALELEIDESQNFPEPGWKEIIETLNRTTIDATWRCHGVTRGIRDYFYKFTQPDSGWTVHRIVAQARPIWTDEERKEKIQMYGSRNSPDYRRNVLGLHGDQTNALFELTRLMKCIQQDDEYYNTVEYYAPKINAEMVMEVGGDIEQLLNFPISHAEKYGKYKKWIGQDVGFTIDPSEILVFAEIPDKEKGSYLKLLSRIELQRIRHGDQKKVMLKLVEHYKPVAYAMDKTGNGLPLFQSYQESAPDQTDVIKGYNFSSKILVDFDQSIEVDPHMGDLVKDAGITRNVLEYSSDILRGMVDANRLILPFDEDLIKEFNGETWQENKTGMDQYGRRRTYSSVSLNILDGARMAILGWKQFGIEEFTKTKPHEDVLDIFF